MVSHKIFSLETVCLTVQSVKSTRTKITAYLNPTIVFLGTKNAAVLAFTLLEYLPVALSFHCAGCSSQHLGIGFHGCTCGPALR